VEVLDVVLDVDQQARELKSFISRSWASG